MSYFNISSYNWFQTLKDYLAFWEKHISELSEYETQNYKYLVTVAIVIIVLIVSKVLIYIGEVVNWVDLDSKQTNFLFRSTMFLVKTFSIVSLGLLLTFSPNFFFPIYYYACSIVVVGILLILAGLVYSGGFTIEFKRKICIYVFMNMFLAIYMLSVKNLDALLLLSFIVFSAYSIWEINVEMNYKPPKSSVTFFCL